MPYLGEETKKDIDEKHYGNEIYDRFSSMKPEELAGAINYLNFKIVRTWIKKNGKRYWILALIIGTLICCVIEIYRRIVAPYEDECIVKNGDVE